MILGLDHPHPPRLLLYLLRLFNFFPGPSSLLPQTPFLYSLLCLRPDVSRPLPMRLLPETIPRISLPRFLSPSLRDPRHSAFETLCLEHVLSLRVVAVATVVTGTILLEARLMGS